MCLLFTVQNFIAKYITNALYCENNMQQNFVMTNLRIYRERSKLSEDDWGIEENSFTGVEVNKGPGNQTKIIHNHQKFTLYRKIYISKFTYTVRCIDKLLIILYVVTQVYILVKHTNSWIEINISVFQYKPSKWRRCFTCKGETSSVPFRFLDFTSSSSALQTNHVFVH